MRSDARWTQKIRSIFSGFVQKARALPGRAKASRGLLQDIGIVTAAVAIGLAVIGGNLAKDSLSETHFAQNHAEQSAPAVQISGAVSGSSRPRAASSQPSAAQQTSSDSAQPDSTASSQTGSQPSESSRPGSSAASGGSSSTASSSGASSSSSAPGSGSAVDSATAGSGSGSVGSSTGPASQSDRQTLTLTDEITGMPQTVQYFPDGQGTTVSGVASIDTSAAYRQQYTGQAATLRLLMGYNTIVTKPAAVPETDGVALTLPLSKLAAGTYEVNWTVPGTAGKPDVLIARYTFSVDVNGSVRPTAVESDTPAAKDSVLSANADTAVREDAPASSAPDTTDVSDSDGVSH